MLPHVVEYEQGLPGHPGIGIGLEEHVKRRRREGELFINPKEFIEDGVRVRGWELDEVAEEALGLREPAGAGEDVDEPAVGVGAGAEVRLAEGEAEEVEGCVGVEAEAVEDGVEEGVGEDEVETGDGVEALEGQDSAEAVEELWFGELGGVGKGDGGGCGQGAEGVSQHLGGIRV